MLSRFIRFSLILIPLCLIFIGCSTGTTPPPDQPPPPPTVDQAAAGPTDPPATAEPTSAPQTTPTVAEPAMAPTEPAVVTEAPTDPVASPETTVEATTETATAAEPAEIIRTFQIVPEESETTYEVTEEFFNQSVRFFSPIGRTNAIEGQFQINQAGNQVELLDNGFAVDLRTLTSDNARRDRRIRDQWLESNTYPFAQFTVTSVEDFPKNAVEGQPIPFKVTGDMTIRDVTRPLTFDTVATLQGDTFTGTATTNLLMRDFGFEPPEILGMLKVTDGVTVTVNFTAREIEGS